MGHLSLLVTQAPASDTWDGEPGVGYRVLVIAACAFTRRSLSARLARAGFDVQAVADRAEGAIELTLAFVDAVVADLDEPDPRISPIPLVLTSVVARNGRDELRGDGPEHAIVARPCDVVDAVLEALWERPFARRTS